MKPILVLVTCVSLLAGCATPRSGGEVEQNPVSCNPNYPVPITLTPLKKGMHFTIHKDYVELTHAGWSMVIGWMHEAERFGLDAVALQAFMAACIARYNEALKPQDKEQKKSWWKFW